MVCDDVWWSLWFQQTLGNFNDKVTWSLCLHKFSACTDMHNLTNQMCSLSFTTNHKHWPWCSKFITLQKQKSLKFHCYLFSNVLDCQLLWGHFVLFFNSLMRKHDSVLVLRASIFLSLFCIFSSMEILQESCTRDIQHMCAHQLSTNIHMSLSIKKNKKEGGLLNNRTAESSSLTLEW